jgi:hypothetical protein
MNIVYKGGNSTNIGEGGKVATMIMALETLITWEFKMRQLSTKR